MKFKKLKSCWRSVLAIGICVWGQNVWAHGSLDRDLKFKDQCHRSLAWVISNLNLTKGAVVASPSRSNPNYFRHWVRDAGLTMGELVDIYSQSNDPNLKKIIAQKVNDWISFETNIQSLALKESNLGEPLFEVDGKILAQEWGRPQNDGPAIRALAVMKWVDQMRRQGNHEIEKQLYRASLSESSLIKSDLEYVSQNWNSLSHDLWEEVQGFHFFTLMAQRAALKNGAAFALTMNDPGAAQRYLQQVPLIEQKIANHWNPDVGYIFATLERSGGWSHKASELDSSVILASLYFSFDDGFFSPNSRELIQTAKLLESEFSRIYPISNSNKLLAPAMGRYPEDVYDGVEFTKGNPWFIATNGFAEFRCRLGSEQIQQMNSGARALSGRDYLERTLFHKGVDGTLSEQFHQDSGFMRGAEHLTWSHISYIRAARACGIKF